MRGTVEEIELADRGAGPLGPGRAHPCRTGHLRAMWFNQPFLREKFHCGQTLLLSGKAKAARRRWQMVHPTCKVVDAGETIRPPARCCRSIR